MEEQEYQKHADIELSHGWFRAKRDLISNLLDNSGKKGILLDVGCGMGINLHGFRNKRVAWGIDISRKSIKYCSRYCKELIQADVEYLPFKDGSFETVTSLDLLEHVSGDEQAAKEFKRILVGEGVLIVSVPAYSFLFSEHDRALHHRRRYSKKALEWLISKDLKIERIFYWNFFLFPVLAARIIFDNLRKRRGESYVRALSPPINYLVYKILSLENYLTKYFNFPYGLSLMCIARKKD